MSNDNVKIQEIEKLTGKIKNSKKMIKMNIIVRDLFVFSVGWSGEC